MFPIPTSCISYVYPYNQPSDTTYNTTHHSIVHMMIMLITVLFCSHSLTHSLTHCLSPTNNKIHTPFPPSYRYAGKNLSISLSFIVSSSYFDYRPVCMTTVIDYLLEYHSHDTDRFVMLLPIPILCILYIYKRGWMDEWMVCYVTAFTCIKKLHFNLQYTPPCHTVRFYCQKKKEDG